jgi:hypothetical protein
MGKLETATFQKITETLHPLLLTAQISKRTWTIWIKVCGNVIVEILGNHNIAAEDQHIAVLIILNVNVAEL